MDKGKTKIGSGAEITSFSTVLGSGNTSVPTDGAVKTYTDNKVNTVNDNVVLNAFRIAVNGSLTQFNMVDGIVDEYEDESGIVGQQTVLLLSFDGTDGATTTTDESSSAHAITFNGNAQLDTALSKFGTASLLLDGTGDYLSIPDSDDWNFGSGDFTIDLWAKFNSHTDYTSLLMQGDDSTHQWALRVDITGELHFTAYKSDGSFSANYVSTSSAGVTDGSWHHIAFVRSGSTTYMFVDGTSITVTESTAWNGTIGDFSGLLSIGRNLVGANYYFDGWLDEIRISKGVARWTTNFTPETSEYVISGESSNISYDSVNDLYSPSLGQASSLVLLLDGDGPDAATSLLDLSGNHTLTFNGNAQLDTAQKKFGTASMLFDGTGDYISIPTSSDFTFGTGDFVIDLHVKFNALGSQDRMLGDLNAAGSLSTWGIQKTPSDGITALFNNGSQVINSANPITDTNWHHYRFGRNGNTGYLYIDGVSEGTVDMTGVNLPAISAGALGIGRHGDFDGQYFAGWIDAVRIQKGVAVDSSGFTPPTEMYATNTEPTNMTLQSISFTAEAQADSSRIVLFEEDVDTITLNTDLKAYASRDGGTTFSQITLVNEGEYETGKNILAASVDISAQPAGTSMVYKLETLNNKDLKIHGTGLSWD